MADSATPHPEAARFESASDIDHRRTADIPPTPPIDEVPFAVLGPPAHGFVPFYPPPDSAPPASPEAHVPENDNPLNPKGGPSLSLPQQATPLTSRQDVLTPEEMIDPDVYLDLAATQDGLAPDDPRNPRGTPDYIVEGPAPRSNPYDEQHDGRTSHEQTEPVTEPQQYWEGDAGNGG
jgi:hypothetical protein